MIILGLDPGIARTGFGIINTTQPHPFVQCGCITTPSHTPTEDRLVSIANDLSRLLEQYRPDAAVIEDVFFGANTKTAMLTAQTRGVLLYLLKDNHIEIQSLTPLQIKSRLTGYGGADKTQIQTLVQKQLNLNVVPQPDDAADALAAALCFR